MKKRSGSLPYRRILSTVLVTGGLILLQFLVLSTVPQSPVTNVLNSGRILTFASRINGTYDIFAVDLDTRLVTNLTKTPDTSEVSARWSPDGSQIAFSKCRTLGVEYAVAGCEIYVMHPGEPARQLTFPSGADDRDPVWSPDNIRIAFVRQKGNDQALYVINTDGSQLQEICSGTTRCAQSIWSPDGQHLLFLNATRAYIAHFQAGSANIPRIQRLEFTTFDLRASAWSPDSRQIVYGLPVPPAGKDELFVMDIVSGVPHQLTADARKILAPQWNQDGTQITFTANFDWQNGKQFERYSIRADGTGLEYLGESGLWDGVFSVWSPDERLEAFALPTRARFVEVYESQLYISRADGTDQQQILTWDGEMSGLQWRPRTS